MKKQRKIKEKYDAITIILLVFLFAYMVAFIVPYIWALVTSLKNEFDFMYNVIGLPDSAYKDFEGNFFGWQWGNYRYVFSDFKINYNAVAQIINESGVKEWGTVPVEKTYGEMMWNSVVYSLCSAFVTTLCTFMVAYAAAMFPYKFSTVLDVIVLGCMAIPIVGNMASSMWMFKTLNLYGNFFGMVFIGKFSFQSMYYLVLKAYLKGLPPSLREAAQIDGAGNMSVLLKVMLPLALPAISTVFVIYVISYWNDWQTSQVYLQEYPTAAYGLYKYVEEQVATPYMIAAVMLLALPVLVVFAIFNKRLMGGVSIAGGVKE